MSRDRTEPTPAELRRYSKKMRGPSIVKFLTQHGGSYTAPANDPYGVANALAAFWNIEYPGSDHNRGNVTNHILDAEKGGYILVDRNPMNTPVRITIAPSQNGHERMRLGEVIERAASAPAAAPPVATELPVPAPPKPGTTNAELDARLCKAFDAIHSIERDLEAGDNIATEMGEHVVAINARIHALMEWARAMSKNLGVAPPHLRDSQPGDEYTK